MFCSDFFIICFLYEWLYLWNLFDVLVNEREVDFKVILIMNIIFILKLEYGLDSMCVVLCRVWW